MLKSAVVRIVGQSGAESGKTHTAVSQQFCWSFRLTTDLLRVAARNSALVLPRPSATERVHLSMWAPLCGTVLLFLSLNNGPLRVSLSIQGSTCLLNKLAFVLSIVIFSQRRLWWHYRQEKSNIKKLFVKLRSVWISFWLPFPKVIGLKWYISTLAVITTEDTRWVWVGQVPVELNKIKQSASIHRVSCLGKYKHWDADPCKTMTNSLLLCFFLFFCLYLLFDRHL